MNKGNNPESEVETKRREKEGRGRKRNGNKQGKHFLTKRIFFLSLKTILLILFYIDLYFIPGSERKLARRTEKKQVKTVKNEEKKNKNQGK